MRCEALSFVSDKRTRAIRGFAKRSELTTIQTLNKNQRFDSLFHVSCNALDPATSATALNILHVLVNRHPSSSSAPQSRPCDIASLYCLLAEGLGSTRVVPLVVIPIFSRSRMLEPLATGLVPLDRSANSILEAHLWPPT